MKAVLTSILFLILAVNSPDSEGQSYELSKADSKILISGTSSLHDWEMELKTFNCEVEFIVNGSELKGINKLVFRCRATDIKSDNSLMDKKTYTALKSESFPEIRFNFVSASPIISANNTFSGTLKGDLSIAGKSKTITLPFNGKLNSPLKNGKIEVNSTIELAMSDFEITPPTAMLGTLKTGNKIKISLSVQFVSN